jgi:hypothetical protein
LISGISDVNDEVVVKVGRFLDESDEPGIYKI